MLQRFAKNLNISILVWNTVQPPVTHILFYSFFFFLSFKNTLNLVPCTLCELPNPIAGLEEEPFSPVGAGCWCGRMMQVDYRARRGVYFIDLLIYLF